MKILNILVPIVLMTQRMFLENIILCALIDKLKHIEDHFFVEFKDFKQSKGVNVIQI